MFEYKLFAKSVLGIALSGFMGLSQANAEQVPGRFMPVIGQASAPVGHIEFCQNYPQQCRYGTNTPLVVRLTKERWQELLDVNASINTQVRPLTDEQLFGVAEYWTYPQGAGDCEEYVLEKQRQLIALGWPPSALLITVVKDLNNGGHAVLSVRTDQGDLILDNQISSILPWYSTPYRYVKRQSARHAAAWSAISDKRVTTVASIPE
ncbi:Transglutaminase-like cysteine peptidase [Pseudovibrio sp. FO-BEG1]|uniref:transglutaminase-like cysteine peptidase n=1 Tax=unclassified Pseudovibrio TaxID=2627060 RepID=UPI000186B7E5|nr:MULTISPECIES: transglutaminase-like cysteine peptidase [unclassified Pseudovibrio]AEV38483.1 Transglutaminase-like cysteine peptidase [Pseudovibrio sp. FO-BEG1]EEA96111.1 hypothetical protein PJE062_5150 [Pseudovibrio sp. JE062]